jgi:hypothetical protein
MEGTSFYKSILKKAWNITKKFKSLWFFGLFVAILGTSGSYEIMSRVISRPTTKPGIISGTLEGLQNGLSGSGTMSFFQGLWQVLTNDPQTFALMIIILVISIAITIFFIWLSVISQIGIIKNINDITNSKKPTINEGIDFATKKFWPTLGINIVLRIIFFIIFVILGWALIAWSPFGGLGAAAYYVALLIFIVVIFILSFVVRAQIYYLTLKNLNVFGALKTAFNAFRKNWLVVLELTVLLFAIYTIATFIVALVGAMAITFPLILLFYYTIPAWLTSLLSVASLAIAITISFFITSVVISFQWVVWVLFLNQLNTSRGLSGIARGAKKLLSYIRK